MVPKVLSASTAEDEFAHTVLHGRDVFAELQEKKKEQKERKLSDSSGLSNENTVGSLEIEIESKPVKADSDLTHLLSLRLKDF